MPTYKFKTELLGIPKLPAIFSGTPEDIEAQTLAARQGLRQVSAIGGLVPFHTVPFVDAFYEAGWGTKIHQQMSHLWETYRLAPAQVIQLWLRSYDKPIGGKDLWEQLKDQGWEDSQIDAIKELSKVLPSPTDIIQFAVREVYTPEIAEKYGQFQDFPDKAMPDAAKLGLTEELFKKYWAAHWNLPSRGEGYELLRRDEISEDELKTLLKAQDVMPYWRDRLNDLAWEYPNRIEIRMMSLYLFTPKSELIDLLKKSGLKEEYRNEVADMMIARALTSYWATLYGNGWIGQDELDQQIVASGVSATVGERIFKTIVQVAKPQRVAAEKSLTKAEIYKGVKKQVISYDEGISLLADLGYDEWEAHYLLDINVEALKGSPESYLEFKRITSSYRKSEGLSHQDISQQLLDAEKSLANASHAQRMALEKGASPQELATLQADVYSKEAAFQMLKKQAGLV